MQRNFIETLIGFIVLSTAAVFLYLLYSHSGHKMTAGYDIHAYFERIDGIKIGSDVKIGGIKIGSVKNMQLDKKRFLAHVTLSLEENVNIPIDSSAEISAEGLLGNKYIALVPGSETDFLKKESEIQYTQSSMDLMGMISKFMFSSKSSES